MSSQAAGDCSSRTRAMVAGRTLKLGGPDNFYVASANGIDDGG